jgi:hypothetical protein
MDFLNWYKYMIESAEQEPPEESWEEIQNQLDIDAVWTGVNRELQSYSNKRGIYRYSAAASLILLISAGAFFFSKNIDQLPDELTIHTDHLPAPVLPATDYDPALTPLTEITVPGIAHFQSHSKPQPSPVKITRSPMVALAISRNETLIPSDFMYEPDIRNQYTLITANDKPATYDQGIRSQMNPGNTAGYYAGLSGHLGNTWLLNNKTMQGLRRDDLTASLPSFGYSFGIIAGKTINKRFDIQAEGYFIFRTGQSYNEYLHGQYVHNKLQFNYSNITLSGRWFFVNGEKHGRHSLLLGAYAGILRNAVQDLDGKSISLKSEYHSADYGIIAGYEHIHHLSNQLALGTGFQTRIGLNNIFAGNEVIPGYLNNTRNASFNLMISLRYNLR